MSLLSTSNHPLSHSAMSAQPSTTPLAPTSNLSGLFDTPMTPAEIIADATSVIITTVTTIKKTKDMTLWMQVQRDVWTQLVSYHFMLVSFS